MDEHLMLDDMRKLLSGLVGKVVVRDVRKVPSSGNERLREPHLIFEELVGHMLKGFDSGASSVVGGKGQFPDWKFENSMFEVKSSKIQYKRFMVGAVKKMAEAFNEGNPKYLRANYVVFYYSELSEDRLRVDEVSIGKLWDYSKPTDGRSGSRPQWPSSRLGAGSPLEWADLYLENAGKRGYPVSRQGVAAALNEIGVELENSGEIELKNTLQEVPNVSENGLTTRRSGGKTLDLSLFEDQTIWRKPKGKGRISPKEAVERTLRLRVNREHISFSLGRLRCADKTTIKKLAGALEAIDPRLTLNRMIPHEDNPECYSQVIYDGSAKAFILNGIPKEERLIVGFKEISSS